MMREEPLTNGPLPEKENIFLTREIDGLREEEKSEKGSSKEGLTNSKIENERKLKEELNQIQNTDEKDLNKKMEKEKKE